MILRRFMKHITDQNWFAVGLDVVVVIVGIFLGLQVQTWYENREAKIQANAFVEQLHEDLILAEAASKRVLLRRFSTFDDLRTAMNVLLSDDEQILLGENECTAIASSILLNIVIADLPSLVELQNTGRIHIIENEDLRRSAISLQQRIISLKELMRYVTSENYDLAVLYPDLFTPVSIIDSQSNEVDRRYVCDPEAMRSNAGFMVAVSTNFDVFDAYLRDGLVPWKKQFDELHHLTDQQLGLNHSTIANQ